MLKMRGAHYVYYVVSDDLFVHRVSEHAKGICY